MTKSDFPTRYAQHIAYVRRWKKKHQQQLVDNFGKPHHTEYVVILLWNAEIDAIITGWRERWQTAGFQFEILQMVVALFDGTLENERAVLRHSVD